MESKIYPFKNLRELSLSEAINSGKFSINDLYDKSFSFEFMGETHDSYIVPKNNIPILCGFNKGKASHFTIDLIGLHKLYIHGK